MVTDAVIYPRRGKRSFGRVRTYAPSGIPEDTQRLG